MKKVLVLDDDRDLCQALKQLLELAGAQKVDSFYSVADLRNSGATILNHELAILDVNLGPEVESGLDAFHWLRSKGFAGRIVFFTGHASSHPIVAEALRVPGVELIEKPAGVDRLEALVQS